MLKLLRNYIREQKRTLLQMFGLGFLVIIMIVGFLALNFSNSYLQEQYVKDIVGNKFNQDLPLNIDAGNFINSKIYNEERSNMESFLGNMIYYQQEDKKSKQDFKDIDREKMAKSTFQLQLTNPDETNLAKRIYRFVFHGGTPNSNFYCAVGDNLFQATKKEYIDFKINIPNNYPTVSTHDDIIKKYAAILDKYVYNETTKPENKTNFFIMSDNALEVYQQEFFGNLPYANRKYSKVDILDEVILYKIMILGMLYQDIQWNHSNIVNDLLTTSKNFAFIETAPQFLVGKPIIVKNGGASLESQPLKDNEILIYEQFAKLNNLHIGQNYLIAGQQFIIRGYATSSIVAYAGSYFQGVLDLKNNTVAFVNSKTMEKIASNLKQFIIGSETSFLGINPDQAKNIVGLDNDWIYQYLHQRYNESGKIGSMYLANGIDSNNFMVPLQIRLLKQYVTVQNLTLSAINSRINIIEKISSLFLVLIFIVTAVIIFIITFKMIDRNKKLIGVLKATGYKSWQLTISLVVSVITPLFLFALLGVLISVPLAHFLIVVTNTSTVALITYGWYFSVSTAFLLIAIPMISLTVISFFMVLFLLRFKPLDLITNNYAKKKYKISVGVIFTFVTRYVIRNFNYRNKLAVTTSIRSFGKTLIMCFTSIFAATLVLFALAGSGLINNMLGLQFAGIDYNFQNIYKFNNEIKNNFINKDNKLLYQFDNVENIQKQPSLYPELMAKLKEFDPNHDEKPLLINLQNRYIMGSELLKIRKEIAIHSDDFPPSFIKFLDDNKALFDYLTNDNGHSDNDLILSFGLVPYDSNKEIPYTKLDFVRANSLYINQPDTYFDNDKQILVNYQNNWAANRIAYGLENKLNAFLTPTFVISSFDKFSNLTLEKMMNSNNWQDKQFISIREQLIAQLGITNPEQSAIQFIPMATTNLPGIKSVKNGGEALGRSVIYTYQGLDKQTKYIVGIAYDSFNKLDADITLMPKVWLNNILFGNKNNLLQNNFANSKFSKLTDNEFKHYLPIISTNNDYEINLAQLVNAPETYLNEKGITTSLSAVSDINSIYNIIKTTQYSLQVVITFFGIFSVILSMMIIVVVTNILVRDNLILINILRSLGYSASEVSYNFFLVIIPTLILSSLCAVFITPPLVGTLSNLLTTFSRLPFPVVLHWWYFAVMLFMNIVIYLISYIITWKLNVNNKELMNLTK